MKHYLLDTNICIFLLNQNHGFESIVDHISKLYRDQVLISSITVAELEFGVSASQRVAQNEAKLELFLASFKRVAFGDAAARAYGKIRANLKLNGRPIGPLDTLLAGHAVALNACMVTNNVGEFSRVNSLVIEDWSVPV